MRNGPPAATPQRATDRDSIFTMETTMKLYYHPLSAYSQKALVALYEKNVPFEPELVNLMDRASVAAYRKLYPLGKVPLLQLENGRLIPESSIIIEYIDTHFDSGAALIPLDMDLGRRTRFYDRQFDLYVTEPVAELLFDAMKPESEREPKRVARARETLDIMYPYLDSVFQKRKGYIIHDALSMADCAAAPALFYAKKVHPFDAFPHIVAYYNRLQEHAAVARVRSEAAPYLTAILEK
jgi:glutathione S-transferase